MRKVGVGEELWTCGAQVSAGDASVIAVSPNRGRGGGHAALLTRIETYYSKWVGMNIKNCKMESRERGITITG